ncbi:MAG: M48 family metallopeptidase [Persicimonas sp.]
MLPSCATGPGERATGAAADVLLPPSEEEQLGEEMRAELLKEVDLLDNEEIQSYVDSLGRRAVRAADGRPRGIDYNFSVIEGDEVNAFAMPGGEIYVYSGLLEEVENEAELMSVIAHEVAHVTERHIARRLVQAYGLQALMGAALGEEPGVVAELVAGVAAQGYLLKYSRSQEADSDRHGVEYMVEAGYDPQAFISFFKKMQRGGASPPEFLSSHPNPENRIAAVREQIRKMGDVPDALYEERYQEMTQGLDGGGQAAR